MDILLLIPLILSFFITLIILPYWIKKARVMGLVGEDLNKYNKTKIAEVGGITVIAGFTLGLLIYVAIRIFYFNSNVNLIEIFVILAAILILSFIGMIDSLLATKLNQATNPDVSSWRKGLEKRYRILLCLFAAVPLMVINAGYHTISIPFLGIFRLDILYPLLVIPLGIVGASTTFNFLAGFNGLEAGQGIIIIGALSIVSALTGSGWLAMVGLCMTASLLAFWLFNKYPAKVFPGDVLTYPLGGIIAIMAILGNFEKLAIFFFTPYILETFLKLRGKLKKQSYGKPNKDGSLELPYEKIYGLEHAAIWLLKKVKKNGKVYEREVVYLIHGFQIIIVVLGFIIFWRHIF